MNDLMQLVDEYAEARARQLTQYTPATQTAEARQRVEDYVSAIGAGGVSGPLMGGAYSAEDMATAAAQGFREGQAAERDACAFICDEMRSHYSALKDTALLNGDVAQSNVASGEPRACLFIAQLIRSRGAA